MSDSSSRMHSSTAATLQQQPAPKSHTASRSSQHPRLGYHRSPDVDSGENDIDIFYDTNSSKTKIDAPNGGVERSCITDDDGTSSDSEDIFTSLAIDQFAALLKKEQRYAGARVYSYNSNANSNRNIRTNVDRNGNDHLSSNLQSHPLSPQSGATTNSKNPNPSPTSTSTPDCNCSSSVPLHEIYCYFAKESGYEEGERYEDMPTSPSISASARSSPTTSNSSTSTSSKSTSENCSSLNTRMGVRASVAKYVTMVLDHYHQHREILHVVMSYLDAFFCKRYQQQQQHQRKSQNQQQQHQHQNKSQYEYQHNYGSGSQCTPEESSQECTEFWTVILVAIDMGIQLYSPCSGDGYRACKDYVLQVQEEQRQQQQRQHLENSFDTENAITGCSIFTSNLPEDLNHDEEALHKRVKKVFRQSGNFYQYYHFTTLMELARMANITVAAQVPTPSVQVQSPVTHMNRAPLRDLQSTSVRNYNSSTTSNITVTSPITKDHVAVVQSTLLTTLDFYLHPTTPTRILQTLLQALEVDIIKVVMAQRDEDESMMTTGMMQGSHESEGDVGDNRTSAMSVGDHVLDVMDKLGQKACGQTDIIFYHASSRPERTSARTQHISSPSNTNPYHCNEDDNSNHTSNMDMSATPASVVAMASMINAIHGTFPDQYANYLCDQMCLIYENARMKGSLLSLSSALLPNYHEMQVEIAYVCHVLLDLSEKEKMGTLFHTPSHRDENGDVAGVDLEGEDIERTRNARSPVSVSDRSVAAIGEDGAKGGNGRNNGVHSDLESETCNFSNENMNIGNGEQSTLQICEMDSYEEDDVRDKTDLEKMNMKNSSLHARSHSRHLAPKPKTDPIVHDLYKEFSVPLTAATQAQLYQQPHSNDMSRMCDQDNTTRKLDLDGIPRITTMTDGVRKHCSNLAIAPDAKTKSFDPIDCGFFDAWTEAASNSGTQHVSSANNASDEDIIFGESTTPESSSDNNIAPIHSDPGVRGGEYISTLVSLACCCSRSRPDLCGKNYNRPSQRSRRRRSNSESSSSISSGDDSNSINSAKRIEHKLGKIDLDSGRRKRAKHVQYQLLEDI